MIIPIGHDGEGTFRRPWVTLAVMILCCALWGATLHFDARVKHLPRERFREKAQTLWQNNRYLEVDEAFAKYLMEQEDPELKFTKRDPFTWERWESWLEAREEEEEAGYVPAEDVNVFELQKELDDLVAYGFHLEPDQLPLDGKTIAQRFGLTPASPTWYGYIAHIFLHMSWGHILGNLFLFYLVAPAIEDRWGRPVFAAFFLTSGVFAGALHRLLWSDSPLPLIGASGAVAGVLGAFLLLFWRERIKFFYYFIPPLYGVFRLRAWIVLPFWFGNELLHAWISQLQFLENISQGGVAYWAHVGGFLFGALFATLMRGMRIEERFLSQSIEKRIVRSRSGGLLREARQALAERRYEHAFLIIEPEVQGQPDNLDVLLTFWAASVACFKPKQGAAPLIAWLRANSSGKQAQRAADVWLKAIEISPAFDCDPNVLFHLVPALLELGRKEDAARALGYILSREHSSLSFGLLNRVRQMAAGLDPAVELVALRRLSESSELPDPKRQKIVTDIAQLERRGVKDCPDVLAELHLGERRGGVIERDGSVAIDLSKGAGTKIELEDRALAIDLSNDSEQFEVEGRAMDIDFGSEHGFDLASAPRFSSARRTTVKPVSVHDTHLIIRLESGQEARLDFSQIQGLSFAIVSGVGPKPVLLIDFLLNHRDSNATELRVVRMQSNSFNPLQFYPDAKSGETALRILLRYVKERSGADLLPTQSIFDDAFARFASLQEYEREALGVAP